MIKFYDFSLVPRIKEAEALYFKKQENTISFCSYYNAVPVAKLRKYTTVSSIIFRVKVQNETKIFIRCSEPNNVIRQEIVSSSAEIIVSLFDIPDSVSILYFTAEGGEVLSVSVYLEGNERQISPALITCTYKREKQLKTNIDYLLKMSFDNEFDIIVSDNGSTIPEDYFSDNRVVVIHNPNRGGSGGYDSGLKEAVRKKKYTHFILMDDDVTVEYCAIQKVLGFIRFLKTEYENITICGSMISISDPLVQFESGGFFSNEGIQKGYCYHNDISSFDGLMIDESEKNINYAAWWLMCMPSNYVESGEYPAPFFIKYDDVEYSLRCKMDIISLIGFGIWHEDFGKKYNAVSEYFNTRNYLFLLKRINNNYSSFKAFRKALYFLFEKICRQQYSLAQSVILGYRDFLRGEEYLDKIDYSALMSELNNFNILLMDDEEIFAKYSVKYDEKLYNNIIKKPFRRYMRFFLYGQSIPFVFCRKITVTDCTVDRKEHYFRAGKVLHYNPKERKGYVTKKSFFNTFVLLLKFLYNHFKFTGG